MAAKEKLALLERERTKKEKEKIQAERKRKAAQFLASMKIVSSSNINPVSSTQDVKIENNVLNTNLSKYCIFVIKLCVLTMYFYYIQICRPKILL